MRARATDPRELRGHPDPVGPRNVEVLIDAARRHDRAVAAWWLKEIARDHGDNFTAMAPWAGCRNDSERPSPAGICGG